MVAHGCTGETETNTYGEFKMVQSTSGGVFLRGFKDADGTGGLALLLHGVLAENADTTKSNSGRSIIEIGGNQSSGTALADVVADGNVLGIRVPTTGTIFIVDEDGDLWLNGGVDVNSTTNSTSATTGSIHTDGGIGIAED